MHFTYEDMQKAKKERNEALRFALEQIAWMDEFLDADGAKAMMEIARKALRDDAQSDYGMEGSPSPGQTPKTE